MDKKQKRPWTTEEIKVLRDNYFNYGAKHCAKLLNRSVSSIFTIAAHVGISQKGSVRQEMIDFLSDGKEITYHAATEWLGWTKKRVLATLRNNPDYFCVSGHKKIGRYTHQIWKLKPGIQAKFC